MKKQYQHPTMEVVKTQATYITCTSIDHVDGGDTGITIGGGGSGPARVRNHNIDWDDSDDWDNSTLWDY
ncbi:MAG: hypothetical protein IJ762_07590 [Bacteroidaceae bacterium]|nr:hypothetical protein [Bacteroidaceae bacterium]MBR1789030.1 hypothetical protein [Bacteroidaceae bacterium]